ncbi:MAG: type II toxin-antitoxin system RelE/ParE family toxin [Anaerolineales bacterium]|nr:type II toxin-antitoxin system RelE/ParE family toxin [Anaerolineales bacterium]
MTWRVRHTRTFYKELAKLPEDIRTKIEIVAFGDLIKEDPFLEGKVQKLTGYQEYYKIRFGNYRVGLRINRIDKVVEFRRVLHRREIYRKFP